MPDQFANPLGFLALLAIPVILAIHLLREKSRRIPVSTLFLLERLEPRTPTGRTFHWLQNSLPLWLQLLMALLCTWLLVQPRWLRADSRQRVTVILDPTASMSVALPRVREELPAVLDLMARGAAHTDWIVFTADRPESALYRGSEVAAAQAALAKWQPVLPGIDPARAFSVALLDARGGPVVFVTDHQPDTLPAGITLLAYGEAIQNCGFAGVRTWQEKDGAHFEALVRNSGDTPQQREWWIETDRFRSQPQKLTLAPGEIAAVPGPFPQGEKQVRVELSPDGFTLDDVLPLVVPQAKPLLVSAKVGANATRFVERMLPTVGGVQRVTDPTAANVVIATGDRVGTLPEGCDVVVLGSFGGETSAVTAPITVEQDPLTEGANWNALLSPGPGALGELPETDQPLVWQKGKPLISLRPFGSHQRLLFNFDFEHSNADRLPATVLMLSRFLARAQSRKVASFAENFETNQVLPLPGVGEFELVDEGGAVLSRSTAGSGLRSPVQPGFFRVRGKDGELLRGAARFGDPREADFRAASTSASKIDRALLIKRENLVGDRWSGVWLAGFAVALVGSWVAQSRMARV